MSTSILAVASGLCMLSECRLMSGHMIALHDVKSSASPFAAVLITHVAHGISFLSLVVNHINTHIHGKTEAD